jgi:hypothetical protein
MTSSDSRRTEGALALASSLPAGAELPMVPPRLRLVDGLDGVGKGRSAAATTALMDEAVRLARAERSIATFIARRPTSADELPDVRAFSARLAQAIVETLHGQRPIQQLLRWTDETVYGDIADRLAQRPHAVPAAKPVLRGIRICTPTDGIAEASVVVQTGPRCRAVAMRLEGLDGRWRCTAFELV